MKQEVDKIFLIIEVKDKSGKVRSDSITLTEESYDDFFKRGRVILDYLIHKNNLVDPNYQNWLSQLNQFNRDVLEGKR